MQKVCTLLGDIELANLTTAVVDKMHYYATVASKREILRDVLDNYSQQTFVPKQNACCERKTIAKLEIENRTEAIKSGKMIVK